MADVTRETIEALSEKIETFAAGLQPEERAVFASVLAGGDDEVEGYGSYDAGLQATLAAAIELKPGTSIPAGRVARSSRFLNMRAIEGGVASKV